MQEELKKQFSHAKAGERIEYTGSLLVMRDIAQRGSLKSTEPVWRYLST